MKTAKDMGDAIGRRGSLLGCAGVDLFVYVVVVDVRQVFARIEYRVEPVAGSGRAWVGAGRVILSDERVADANAQTLAEILAEQTPTPAPDHSADDLELVPDLPAVLMGCPICGNHDAGLAVNLTKNGHISRHANSGGESCSGGGRLVRPVDVTRW